MDKKKTRKAVVAGIIIAELAVLDYCAYRLMRGGVAVEISTEELQNAAAVARQDMRKECE